MQGNRSSYVSTRRIGDAQVTAINEGRVRWAPELSAPEAEWRLAMGEVDDLGRIPADHHAVHIRLGEASVLVDAGLDDPGSQWGRKWEADWAGAERTPGLTAGLASVGVRPDDITHVVITHAHYDHIVGLTVEREGRHVPRYPYARVLLGRAEWEGNAERDDPRSDVSVRLGAIERVGLLDLVQGDREVAPGIWMLHAPGESPGHSIVRVVSGDEEFYALGDLVHHAVEVEHPDWAVPWVNMAQMRASRERFFEELASSGALAVFSHEPFPPFGWIVQVDGGYRWERDSRAS